jgi:glycosyltransferase involved in cell wall biosynthesis
MSERQRAIYHHRTQGRDVEAVHIRGIASGLERLGYAVEIVGPPGVDIDPDSTATPATGKNKTIWGVIARRVPQVLFECLEIGYNFAALPRLLGRCRADRPAVIYERYALFNAAGVLAGRLTGTPVVLEVNETAGVDRTRQGKRLALGWLARWLEKQILRSATGVVVVSGYLSDYVQEAGVPAERVRVTPNAVDAARFDPSAVDGPALRRRLGLEGSVVIGFAGSFTKWHGTDLLLEAAGRLMAERPEVKLLLVGDGARRSAAEEQARALNIADRVVFTGKLPHAEIPAYMAAMEIGVMPASNVYGSPMKVFEYMAMGCAAVAPRYRPLEEAIDPGQDGLLFEPQSAESLYDSLRALVDDEELRRNLGRRARQRVLERHQWVNNAETVLELARASGSERRATAAETVLPRGTIG